MGVIVVVCAAFSLTVSKANCYKWWPYILAICLEPTYYILHVYHQNKNDYNIAILLVF